MTSEKGPNIKKKQKCKNCEGKGLLKKGDKVVKCQRCKGTGVRCGCRRSTVFDQADCARGALRTIDHSCVASS